MIEVNFMGPHNYWSCSKIADKIRGTTKPYAASGSEWDAWYKAAKKAHPFRYWLVETLLDRIQTVLYYPYGKILSFRYYIYNRYIAKTHALTIHKKNMKRGSYSDVDSRMFYALFDTLVDYVEVELASFELAMYSEEKKKVSWWKKSPWKLIQYRRPDLGIRKLKYDIEHYSDEEQGKVAKKILDLYHWYINIRANREDPHITSGLDEYYADKTNRGIGFMKSDPNPNNYDIDGMRNAASIIEQMYYDEDTEMMVELIKIRSHLWT
jgi:hypothetical protein